MKKISYKNSFLTIVIILYTIATVILYDFLSTITSSNVGDVSKKHYKTKTLERENYIDDFFKPYFTTIKSIKDDRNFIEYLSENIEKEFIENYFLSIKKSLPCLIEVSYLDSKANEIINIDGLPINLYKENHKSRIVPQNELENKQYSESIVSFLSLEKEKIGLSKIDLNKKNNKILIPKQPTLRLGMAVYDNEGEKKGIVVLSICLRTFFKLIDKTILYDIYLIDEKGNFLNHHDEQFALLGIDSNYSIKDQFPEEWNQILLNDEYFGGNFFSYKLKKLKNSQNLKMLLELKFDKELENRMMVERNIIIYFILFIIVSISIIIYFSNLPDKLREEMYKNRLIHSLTKLPNRYALIEDLSNEEFEKSLIILVSINNLIKIQNSYGEKISDILTKEIAIYLDNYDKDNIQKVYINNYNVFTIKFKYINDELLRVFLDKFLQDIENNVFKINKKGLEFSVDVTMGVSDPFKINNNLKELMEAENALENALDKHLQLDIFNIKHNANISEQKENILLAKEIKKAIENDNIILHYQAIYNNKTNEIDKYECLIRMKIEDKLIYPDKFLPLSKQIKKYNLLSKIVVDKSFEFFVKKDYEFSINISITDILDKDFSEYLIEKIKDYNIGTKLVLEIVEQESVENYEEFYKFLKAVKSLGCKIAIDDFGSGYSNFLYIIEMNEYIDYIKIDGSLIKNIITDENSVVLIQSIIFLCSKLDIKTIAEYVENKEIQEFLTTLGINYSQGYYIAKPQNTLVK